MVKIKKSVCVLLSMIMVMECSANVSASINSKNVNKSIKILKEDCDFNAGVLNNIFELTLLMLDNSKLEKEDLSIGESISIYNVEEEKMFNICPVLNPENECVMIAQVSDNGYVSVNDDIKLYNDVLKNANKGKESIVYITDGVIYIEDEKGKTELEDTGYGADDNNGLFDTYTFDEKVDEIIDNEKDETGFEKYGSNLYETDSDLELEVNEEIDNYGARVISKECAIKKFVKQGDYNLCWAASTATIVNYKKKKSLTAKNVADAMGVGYDYGANANTVKSALNHYGLSYDVKDSKISWYTVKNKIEIKKRPFCIGLLPKSSFLKPHMVTGYGYAYDPMGSYKAIKVWDSNGKKIGIKYSTKVYLNGSEYIWIKTVS